MGKFKNKRVALNGGIGGNVVKGNLNLAIRQWKKSLNESGKMEELKKREHFVKPSTIRREEIKDAIYRKRKGF